MQPLANERLLSHVAKPPDSVWRIRYVKAHIERCPEVPNTESRMARYFLGVLG